MCMGQGKAQGVKEKSSKLVVSSSIAAALLDCQAGADLRDKGDKKRSLQLNEHGIEFKGLKLVRERKRATHSCPAPATAA